MSPLLRTVLLAALLIASVPLVANARPVEAPPNALRLQDIQAELSATGAVVVDVDAGVELFGKNPDTPYPPASTAKMLTALVAVQIFDLDELIEVQESDLVAEEISQVGLMAGDQLTVEQLLYGLLLPSGGDAAHALARTGGQRLDPLAEDPVARFVDEMNAVAARLGMENSHFVNPTGLDHPEMYATARDLVRAGVRVLEDNRLSRIVGTPWTTINIAGSNAREVVVENSNDLVLFDGAIGVKTGTEDEAGQCLVNAYWYGGNRILTVVLGSTDRYVDTSTMLSAVETQVRWLRLGGDGHSLGAGPELAEQGLWMPVSRTVVLPFEQAERVVYQIEMHEDEPIGKQLGTVSFMLGSELIAKLPIYSDQDRPKG